MIKFGILGAGKIASVMAETVNMMAKNGEDICLWAVGSRSKDRALEFAQQYNIKNAYDSYESLVSDPRDRKSTRLNSSHLKLSRMPSSA